MSMKKFFGLIILIVGIIAVSTLVGCKDDDEYTYTLINNSSYTVTVMCSSFDPSTFSIAPKSTIFKTSSDDNSKVQARLQYTDARLVYGSISGYTITFTNRY
jgi:hypothetical protein